ncbi:VOC family protein, partial [Glycomyces tarimensis]
EPTSAPAAEPAPAPPAPEPQGGAVAEAAPAATVAAVKEEPPPEPKAEQTLPSPPRQRRAPEQPKIPDNISELLLAESTMPGTDVTDVAATLIVADLQRSVEFYTEALGLVIVDRTTEAAVLEAGFGKVLLWERPDAPPGETGIMHLTFEVGDIDAAFTEMNDAGVEFLHLPRTALLGQNYQLRAAAFRDPDGHGLAITEHRER